MIFKSKIKYVALGGLVLSFLSLIVHMFLANTSAELVQYHVMTGFIEDLNINVVGKQGGASRKLWKKVKALEALQPYEKPIKKYPGFSMLHLSSQSFKKVLIPKASELSSKPKQVRKHKECPNFKPKILASPEYYVKEVFPKLKRGEVIGLVISDGGCLLRASVQPYLAYHPALARDTLAYQGFVELFQDVHTELIEYWRAQMIKHKLIHDKLSVDSYTQKAKGCAL
ncbi:hypothetical protein LXL04_019698 [Taraxacum kok-saghyz]